MKETNKNKILLYYYRKFMENHILKAFILASILVFFLFKYYRLTLDVILPATIGFLLSKFLFMTYIAYVSKREDRLKSIENPDVLSKIYPDVLPVMLVENGISLPLYFSDVLLINQRQVKFTLLNEAFRLPIFIEMNQPQLLKAHLMSHIENKNTLRLKDIVIEDNKIELQVQKTSYYNHLVTNRAIDYALSEHLTLRKMYEPGPTVKPLNESVFSNHIGINLMLITNDHYTVCPKRKYNATYSKNRLTSSVAIGYGIKSYEDVSLADMKLQMLAAIHTKLHIPDQHIPHTDQIEFIGIARSIYEGGKPQFYFKCELPNFSSRDFVEMTKSINQSQYDTILDQDKSYHLVNLNDMKVKDKFQLLATEGNQSRYHKVELSFFMNYYFYRKTIKSI